MWNKTSSPGYSNRRARWWRPRDSQKRRSVSITASNLRNLETVDQMRDRARGRRDNSSKPGPWKPTQGLVSPMPPSPRFARDEAISLGLTMGGGRRRRVAGWRSSRVA